MSNCIACGNPLKLNNQGSVIFILNESTLDPELPFQYKKTDLGYQVSYSTIDQLQSIVEHAKPHFSQGQVRANESTVPFQQFYHYVIDHDLVSLITDEEFTVHLQPIIHLEKDHIFGYEALLRPTLHGKPVRPGQLFEVAELTGLQSLLDQKARKAAVIAKIQHLQAHEYLFINFLPSTIYNPEFCLKHTFSVINDYQINPETLVFEVVETEEIHNMPHLQSILNTYKKNGMKVALDDVGSGFATLDRLTLLAPDIVKIDRAYITDCHKLKEKQSFLQEVMEIARKLNISVLAEGIENREELEYCRKIGVDYAQGYLIGKPQAKPLRTTQVLFS